MLIQAGSSPRPASATEPASAESSKEDGAALKREGSNGPERAVPATLPLMEVSCGKDHEPCRGDEGQPNPVGDRVTDEREQDQRSRRNRLRRGA